MIDTCIFYHIVMEAIMQELARNKKELCHKKSPEAEYFLGVHS